MKLRIKPEFSSLALSYVFACGTLFVVFLMTRKIQRKELQGDYLVPLFLAISRDLLWTSGGLETQLFTFAVTLGSIIISRKTLHCSFLFAVAALDSTRGVFLSAQRLSIVCSQIFLSTKEYSRERMNGSVLGSSRCCLVPINYGVGTIMAIPSRIRFT